MGSEITKTTPLGKVPCDWSVVNLEEQLEALIDYRGKTPKKSESGILTLSAKSVKMGKINYSDAYYVSKETYDKFMVRGFPQKGDILLTTEAPLGCVAQLDRDDVCIAQRLLTLRGKKGVLDNRYLQYYLTSHIGQYQLLSRETGTTVQGIKRTEFKKALITLPPLPEQKRIAHILGSLDDKIELNRQMNQTLEAMAQSLFKSWFVDFDPVIDNALAAGNPIPEPLQKRAERRQALRAAGDAKPLPQHIQTLFPNRFILTDEMGWVPEGWGVGSVGDIIELAYGKSLMANNRVPGPFPVYGSGGISGFHNESICEGPSIVVGRKGTVGSIFWEERNCFPIDTVFFVKLKDKFPLYWVYQTLLQLDIASLGADSAVPGVNRNSVYTLHIIKPDNDVLAEYWKMINSSVDQRTKTVGQNITLSKLRDTLLPKLISGELRISEAEAEIKEALS